MSDPSAMAEAPSAAYARGLRRLAEYWWLLLAYGIVTFGLGLVLALWPGETLTVPRCRPCWYGGWWWLCGGWSGGSSTSWAF
jgi:uncharacterized membrane protein HdeD (DUF308 family)